MAFCNNLTISEYYGYEIDLARKVFTILGWQDDDIEWRCLNWANVTAELRKENDSLCDLAVMGVPVKTEGLNAGISYSWPT